MLYLNLLQIYHHSLLLLHCCSLEISAADVLGGEWAVADVHDQMYPMGGSGKLFSLEEGNNCLVGFPLEGREVTDNIQPHGSVFPEYFGEIQFHFDTDECLFGIIVGRNLLEDVFLIVI